MEWISVANRLPLCTGGHEEYLVILRHKRPQWTGHLITIAEYDTRDNEPSGWRWWLPLRFDNGELYVTHWMPLPEPPKEGRIMTNADRIRAMTDEELAEWVTARPCCPPGYAYGELCEPNDSCKNTAQRRKCWLDWLKQEVTE